MSFEPDPRFQPRALTEDEVRASIAAYAERTGRVFADRAEWMIPLIIEGDAANGAIDTVSRMKNYDRLLTLEEKRMAGINTRIKLCESIVVTLTRAGLDDVNETLQGLVSAPVFARNIQLQADRFAPLGYQQRFSAVEDSRTCAAALELHGQMFEPADVPTLPLPGCDAASCRCSFMGMSPRTIEHYKSRGMKVVDALPNASAPMPAPVQDIAPPAVQETGQGLSTMQMALMLGGLAVAVMIFIALAS